MKCRKCTKMINCRGKEGLRFMQALTKAEQDACKTIDETFGTFSGKVDKSKMKKNCPSGVAN